METIGFNIVLKWVRAIFCYMLSGMVRSLDKVLQTSKLNFCFGLGIFAESDFENGV